MSSAMQVVTCFSSKLLLVLLIRIYQWKDCCTEDFRFLVPVSDTKNQGTYIILRGKEADSIQLCPLNSSTDIYSHIKSLVLTVFYKIFSGYDKCSNQRYSYISQLKSNKEQFVTCPFVTHIQCYTKLPLPYIRV